MLSYKVIESPKQLKSAEYHTLLSNSISKNGINNMLQKHIQFAEDRYPVLLALYMDYKLATNVSVYTASNTYTDIMSATNKPSGRKIMLPSLHRSFINKSFANKLYYNTLKRSFVKQMSCYFNHNKYRYITDNDDIIAIKNEVKEAYFRFIKFTRESADIEKFGPKELFGKSKQYKINYKMGIADAVISDNASILYHMLEVGDVPIITYEIIIDKMASSEFIEYPLMFMLKLSILKNYIYKNKNRAIHIIEENKAKQSFIDYIQLPFGSKIKPPRVPAINPHSIKAKTKHKVSTNSAISFDDFQL